MTTALYDGYCVLCKQTRRTVKALDWLHRVEFLDIHQWSQIEARYPQLDFETAMGQIHVDVGDGRLVGGFEGMRRLLRELPLGFPLWLLLHLPGMNWLGPKLYRLVARNRYRINKFFGVDLCADGTCKIPG
ncbi:MAG TPA: DUF393 domain-containing protein [Phototrophicaceae bacterium]|nr:DUF393 domain-containing protein [Phototrophicaceae bacterium]